MQEWWYVLGFVNVVLEIILYFMKKIYKIKVKIYVTFFLKVHVLY